MPSAGIGRRLDDAISDAMAKHGAFFAFSDEQIREQQADGVEYVAIDGGIVCPANRCSELIAEIDAAIGDYIRQDIATNGKAAVILRELANYEYCITGDIGPTLDALDGYDISEQDIIGLVPEYLATITD